MKTITLLLISVLLSLTTFSQTSNHYDWIEPKSTFQFNIKSDTDSMKNLVNYKLLGSYADLRIIGNVCYSGSLLLATSTLLMKNENSIKPTLIGSGIIGITGVILHIIAPHEIKKLSKYYKGNTIVIPLN